MRRAALLAAVLVLLLLAVPVGGVAQEPTYRPADPSFRALPGATAYSGVADGAGWRIEVPDGWDGTLVLYAHGFVSPLQEELVVQDPPLRPLFVLRDIAWAASSYAENGYHVEDPIERTHGLIEIFTRETGRTPTTVIVHGFSMGGHITAGAIERRPDAYDGALPVCGVLGDTALFDFFTDAAVTGHALAGVEAPAQPDADYLATVLPSVVEGLGVGEVLSHAGRQWSAALQQLSGGERPLFDEAFAFWNGELTAPVEGTPFLFGVYGGALTGGPDPRVAPLVGNDGRAYQLDGDPRLAPAEDDLNRAVARVARTAESAFFPEGLGDPPVPTLSLHTIGDLFVPFSMEQVYAARAEANGAADRFVTRAVRALGHCEFTPEELATAFTDLLDWVEGGPAPAGDDVLDPVVVAHRDFGCAFTSLTRPGLRSCGQGVTIDRVSGPERVSTAVAVARSAFERADAVVLARADEPADALAGAPLAGSLGAPLLLTHPDQLGDEVAEAITDLGASSVVLLGGTAALSRDVAERAASLPGVEVVERLAGKTRFGTATAIGLRVNSPDVIVVNGRGFADAVAASALAAFLETPVVLVETGAIPPESMGLLEQAGGIGRATVVGGTGAVSPAVVDELTSMGFDVDRLWGTDRYATSVAVLQRAVASGMSSDRVLVATGRSAADALGAGPAAASRGIGLLLVDGVDPAGGPASVDLLAGTPNLVGLEVVGGTGAVSEEVVDALMTATGP